MRVTRLKTCYTRHRAMHRDKKENCTITFSIGDTYEYKYDSKNERSKGR